MPSVCTDGACESKSLLTTHGACALMLQSRNFSASRPKAMETRGKDAVGGPSRGTPLLTAKARKVLWFLDNESAKAAFSSGSSAVEDTFEIVSHSFVLEELKAFN